MSKSYKKHPFVHIVVGAERRTKKLKQKYNRSFRRKLNQGLYDDLINNQLSLSKKISSNFDDDFYKEFYSYKENVQDVIKQDYAEYKLHGRKYYKDTTFYSIVNDDLTNEIKYKEEHHLIQINILDDNEKDFNEHKKNIENQYKKELRK